MQSESVWCDSWLISSSMLSLGVLIWEMSMMLGPSVELVVGELVGWAESGLLVNVDGFVGGMGGGGHVCCCGVGVGGLGSRMLVGVEVSVGAVVGGGRVCCCRIVE